MKNYENLYEVLGLKPGASTEEIKSSFRNLAKLNHPDKNNNSKESQINFQIIYNAYDTLITPDKKEKYDIYLKNVRIKKINWKKLQKKSKPTQTAETDYTLNYICSQFNYILWEIEDILKISGKSFTNYIYNGKTIDQYITTILNFIDKWILEPAGFPDYFFEARKIDVKTSANIIRNGSNFKEYKPYVNVEDYYYDIRKRMNNFIDSIRIQDLTKKIYNYEITLLDSITETQALSFHYLGSIKLIFKNEIKSISLFVHSNSIYEEKSVELLKDN